MNRSNYKSASVQGAATLTIAADTIAAGTSNQPGTRFIHSIYVCNRNAAVRYLWVSLASAGGTVFAGLVIQVPLSGSLILDSAFLSQAGLSCLGNVAVYVAVSTSSTTYSGGTAGEHDITVYYTSA